MLRVAMLSTKNVLDFGLNFLSKTCLWGLIKLSLFDVMFLFQFWLKFGSILTALDTQNPLTRWTPILTKMTLPIEYPSKNDFWSTLEAPRRLQDASKASQDASRWLQNVARSLDRSLDRSVARSVTRSLDRLILHSTCPNSNPQHPSMHGPAECAERLNPPPPAGDGVLKTLIKCLIKHNYASRTGPRIPPGRFA